MRIAVTLAALSLVLLPVAARAQPLPPEQIFATPGLVPFEIQLADTGSGEIVLINSFRVPAGQEDAFLRGWGQAAAALGRHPGLLRATMHRGLAGSPLWINVATWASVADLRAALADPAFVQAARGIAAPFYRQLYAVAAGK